jgi:hypothetical protein
MARLLTMTVGGGMLRSMRRHLVSHWRAWLLIAVIVIAVNELIDRNFFDHQEHLDGDFALTVIALVASFFGSYLLVRARRRARRKAS